MRWHKLIQIVVIYAVGLYFSGYACAEAATRKFELADLMPEFSIIDAQGSEFQYKPGKSSAILVVFFSPEKAQSIKAMKDIEQVLKTFDSFPQKLSVLAVSDDPNSVYGLKVEDAENFSIHSTSEANFKLWGTFGVIATPTVFIAGADGNIELIRAGYGYDFAPAIKTGLQVVMGLVSEQKVDEVATVNVSKNTSEAGKANRHLQMAKMLEQKGRYDAALSQLKTALQVDPNAIESAIELGRLYCVISDPNEAISTVNSIAPSGNVNRAKRAFVLGMAYIQLKDYANAEKYLSEAVELDPQSSQMYYELGKIYQRRGRSEEALNAYRKSLDLVFGAKE